MFVFFISYVYDCPRLDPFMGDDGLKGGPPSRIKHTSSLTTGVWGDQCQVTEFQNMLNKPGVSPHWGASESDLLENRDFSVSASWVPRLCFLLCKGHYFVVLCLCAFIQERLLSKATKVNLVHQASCSRRPNDCGQWGLNPEPFGWRSDTPGLHCSVVPALRFPIMCCFFLAKTVFHG